MTYLVHRNLTVTTGTTFSELFYVINPDKTPVDITDYTFEGAMAKHAGAIDAVESNLPCCPQYDSYPLQVGVEVPSQGSYRVFISAHVTYQLKEGKYVYSVTMTDPSGITTQILRGLIFVNYNVNYSAGGCSNGCGCHGHGGGIPGGYPGGYPTPNDGKTIFFYKSDTNPLLGYSSADQPYDNAIIIPGPNDGKLTFKDHLGNELGVFTADQAGDTEITLSQGSQGFSGDYNDLTNKPDIFDGKFTIKDSGGNILGEFTANQEGDTEITLSQGSQGFSGSYNDLTDVPSQFPPEYHIHSYNDLTDKPTIGDGTIAFNAGDGLAEVGTNATANQTSDTVKTFSVKTGDGITIDGGGNVIIDPNYNLDGNITDPGDGAINIDAGLGLEASGDNATANQTGNTTRVLSAKTADGITIDGNGNIIIDPNYNLDGNITPPGDGKITINSADGSEVGTFRVNQDGPTTITLPAVDFPDSLHPSGFIDVSQPAPTSPTHGDIYIQHRIDLADVVADASFVGIAGRTVEEAQFVMFGVDDMWHAGGNAIPTDIQSDWAETDASAASFIKNKPNLQTEVDTYAGDGAINVNAGPGLEATGDNATANQKKDTTRTLSVKTADGITIDGNGNVIIDPNYNLDGNVTAPNDGKLTVKDSNDNVLGEFTANQEGDTEVILPAGDGAGLDCDGVADCLVNVPVDAPKYAFSLFCDGNTYKHFHPQRPPLDWPEGQAVAHLYFELCDPDDHHLLTLLEEGHGYAGGDYSIYRLPAAYIGERAHLAICAPPPVYLDDHRYIYGFHPDIIHVNDLKLYKGVYRKGVTTTEQLWTEGVQVPDEEVRTADGHIRLPRDYCWSCDILNTWKETYFRVEFTCHRGETYHYVFILYDVKPVSIPNPWSTNPEIEEVNIEPMEDN